MLLINLPPGSSFPRTNPAFLHTEPVFKPFQPTHLTRFVPGSNGLTQWQQLGAGLANYVSCVIELDDEAVRVFVALRLGHNLGAPHRCRCGAFVNAQDLKTLVYANQNCQTLYGVWHHRTFTGVG